jgi:hypothetical protein
LNPALEAFQKTERSTAALKDRERVRQALPIIQKKRAAGWSYAEIRQEMQKTLGFKSSLRTLYKYVQRESASVPATGPHPPAVPTETAPSAAPGNREPSPTPPTPTAETAPPKRYISSFIQNLGGEQANRARQEAREKPKSAMNRVDRINRPV